MPIIAAPLAPGTYNPEYQCGNHDAGHIIKGHLPRNIVHFHLPKHTKLSGDWQAFVFLRFPAGITVDSLSAQS